MEKIISLQYENHPARAVKPETNTCWFSPKNKKTKQTSSDKKGVPPPTQKKKTQRDGPLMWLNANVAVEGKDCGFSSNVTAVFVRAHHLFVFTVDSCAGV